MRITIQGVLFIVFLLSPPDRKVNQVVKLDLGSESNYIFQLSFF